MREHHYVTALTWTGDRGTGTSDYRAYGRDGELDGPGKPTVPLSADRTFRGDPARWNPEELLVAALSQCHLLSYLHLCADRGVVVTGYTDEASGTMVTGADGRGAFREVVLRPRVVLAPGADQALALRLHEAAHEACFIAASVAFPVRHEPTVTLG